MSEEYREIFENWITGNNDYPHLKHKNFGGSYINEEVAMKWDGFKLGIKTLRTENARLNGLYGIIDGQKVIISELEAENERLRALTEWQAIESCKGDGWYPVITKNSMGKNIVVMGFADGKDEDGIFWHDGGERFYPTHWMPLPLKPQIEGK